MPRHFGRSSLLSLLLVLLVIVYSSLWASVNGTLLSSHIQGTNLKLQPSRPDNVYYSLRGSTFVLNCTIVASNAQAFNLSWQHDGEQLFSEAHQVDSSTIQLKLTNTTTSNNGFYWCGLLFGNKSQGVNISLIVADPPSPPRNLKWSVVGAIYSNREYRVSWSASSYTGGLPVNYSVKLCLNDSYEVQNVPACKWSSNLDCCPVNVFSTTRNFYCVLKKLQDFISPCGIACNYTISVVATNGVGSATSWTFLPFISLYSATPFPPLAFNVVTTNNDKELRVSWKAKNEWRYTKTEYTILYHAKNAMENKTKIITNKTDFTLLRALEEFMDYHIYLMVRFVNRDGVRSAHSEVLGPLIMKTPPGEPGKAPKVIRDQSVRFPGNAALRNVTVDWELADKSSWHGTPDKYIVYCNHHHLSLGTILPNCQYHVDAMTNITVLQGLNSSESYNVYMKMCNKQNRCSEQYGESYTIKELEDINTPLSNNGGELSSKQIASITVSAVVGCIIALFAIYMLRKWRRGELYDIRMPRLLQRIQLDPPVPHGYNYVEPVEENDYQRLYLDEEQV